MVPACRSPGCSAYLFGDVRPVADLAAVAVNGRHLTVKGLGDIHPGIGPVGGEEVDRLHPMGLDLPRQLAGEVARAIGGQ